MITDDEDVHTRCVDPRHTITETHASAIGPPPARCAGTENGALVMADVDGPKSLARVAAWNVYVDRVQRVMAIQWDHFSAGQHTASITIAPPSEDAVAAIQTVIDRAVADARRDVIHTVLGPIVKTLDRIDNSGKSKHAAVKEFRAELQTLYDTIHALKAADPAAAGRAP